MGVVGVVVVVAEGGSVYNWKKDLVMIDCKN